MQHYSAIWKAIIRPPRDIYDVKDLGPEEFSFGKRRISRTDLELLNHRGLRLKCSHFQPVRENRVAEKLPCVIYLHGNSSSRLEALSCLPVLLKYNITLFCFDMSGSGRSDGEFVSLGYFERDDLSVVIDHLRQTGTVGCIGLWGRSMGAATALMHGDRDPSIAGMVLDSPFTSLRDLAEELVDVFIGIRLPKWMISIAMNFIRSTIKSKARFDINELTPFSHCENSFIPALFVAAKSDTFIHPSHAKKLYGAYSGDKNLVLVDGDHNSARPKFFLDSVAIFFYNTLQCDALPKQAALASSAGFFPEVDSNTVPTELSSNVHDRDRVGLTMRPPDRSGTWEELSAEDEFMQRAIQDSLKHLAGEQTLSEVVEKQKANSSLDFI
jgi:pimeloyl-ACP methyl ester carboxylesterase